MKVLLIILLAAVGSAGMIVLCGASRWSFIYLIRYRFLKFESEKSKYSVSAKHDVYAVVIAVITLVIVALILVYGIPVLREHLHFVDCVPHIE